MGETIHIVRNLRTGEPRMATDIVHSPDDGGYYLSSHDFESKESRTSRKIFRTREAALKAYREKTVRWDAWY